MPTHGPFTGRVLKGGWRLKQVLGAGACAAIYEVEEDTEGARAPASDSAARSWVAKVCPLPPPVAPSKRRKKSDEEKNADLLYYEYTLYNGHLRGHPLVPVVPFGRGYGDDTGGVGGGGGSKEPVRFMIMERLGSDLQGVLDAAGGSLSAREVASLGLGMLEAVRILHEAHRMIFVDVKPQNFLCGSGGGSSSGGAVQEISGVPVSRVYLVDFGLAERYVAAAGGGHRPFRQLSTISGTPEFLSLSCHDGGLAGRRDDLEAVGFVLWHLLSGGKLPWSGAASNAAGVSQKRAATAAKGAAAPSVAPEVAEWVALARATPYEARPDYDAFQALMVSLWRQSPAAGGGRAISRSALATLPTSGARPDATTSCTASAPAQKKPPARSAASLASGSNDSSGSSSATPAKRKENAAPLIASQGRVKRVPPPSPAAAAAAGPTGVASRGGRAAASAETAAASSRGRGAAAPGVADDALAAAVAAALRHGVDFVFSATAGPHDGLVYEVLSKGGAAVRGGRDTQWPISLPKDPEISETHFSAQPVLLPSASGGSSSGGGAALAVMDLHSTNGTYVNQERLTPGKVKFVRHGGVIELGRTRLVVHQLPEDGKEEVEA